MPVAHLTQAHTQSGTRAHTQADIEASTQAAAYASMPLCWWRKELSATGTDADGKPITEDYYGIVGTFDEKSKVLVRTVEAEKKNAANLKIKDILKAGLHRSKRVGDNAITHDELVAKYTIAQKNEIFAEVKAAAKAGKEADA